MDAFHHTVIPPCSANFTLNKPVEFLRGQ